MILTLICDCCRGRIRQRLRKISGKGSQQKDVPDVKQVNESTSFFLSWKGTLGNYLYPVFRRCFFIYVASGTKKPSVPKDVQYQLIHHVYESSASFVKSLRRAPTAVNSQSALSSLQPMFHKMHNLAVSQIKFGADGRYIITSGRVPVLG